MLTFSLKDLNIYISQRSDGDFRELPSVQSFLEEQFAQDRLLHLELENSNKVIVLEKEDLVVKKTLQVFTGDAILTNLKAGERGTNKTLMSMVLGDCFPLIFFDQKSKNIAMIHAGWEPLYLGILDRVWQEILALWQTRAEHLWFFLGPGIRAQSYRVNTEPRQSQHPQWQKYIKKIAQKQQKSDGERWQIDLPAFIKDFLNTHALPKEQLIDSKLDTYALKKEFFSYRRSQEHLAEGEKHLSQVNNGRFFVVCRLPS